MSGVSSPAGGGKVKQVVNSQDGAVATGTTVMPSDDTIPQKTEGDQYLSLAITPKDTANILLIDVVLICSHSDTTSADISAAIFQDDTADALAAATMRRQLTSNIPGTIAFRHKMTAGTTSETTFKVRAGSDSAGTFTFNGIAGGRTMGGVAASSITITEVEP